MPASDSDKLVIGTRGSLLARAQTGWVAEQLTSANPGLAVAIRLIKTTGDRQSVQPLAEVGGKGLFTLELEEALRDSSIDLAVHSAKDLPTELSDGLAILAVPVREDARDALVSRTGKRLDTLREGAVIGTSSPRRRAQLRLYRSDLQFTVLRGNVDTRLAKVRRGDCDATVLAMAGLNRAGLADAITEALEFDVMVPAAGQGALALEGRAGDERVGGYLASLHDTDTAIALYCERRLIERLAAGCLAPIGAHARREGEKLYVDVIVATPDGKQSLRACDSAPLEQWADLADGLANRLLEQGAAEIIAVSRDAT